MENESYTKEEIELLDRFAGLAMNAELVRDEGWSFNSDRSLEEGCRFSYRVAKEMLRARKEALNNV